MRLDRTVRLEVRQGASTPRDHLVRRRPSRALDRLEGSQTGLVVGPQGAGKTTLLAQWSSVWAPANRRRVVRARAVGGGAGTMTVADLARDVADRVEPTLVVVDDAHELLGTPTERDFERLVAGLPAHVTLLAASRSPELLNSARTEVLPAVTVQPTELRFRAWEVDELFRDVYRMPLTPESVAALTWHTQGWAAALHLFGRSVAEDLPGERAQAVRRLDHRYRFGWDYVVAQVLRPLPVEVQRFLHETAAFEVLTAARCDDLRGEQDSLRMLRELAAASSLVETLDGATFVVHPVVRRHLVTAVTDEMTTAEIRSWYGRAADVLERHGHPDEALRARCRAGDLEEIRRLLSDGASHDWGSSPTREWASLLPVDALEEMPIAQVFRARELASDGCYLAADAWLRRAAAALDATELRPPAVYEETRRVVDSWLGRLAEDDPAPPPGDETWDGIVHRAAHDRPLAAAARARGLRRNAELAEGFALLVAGNERAAQTLLRRAASDPDAEPVAMIAAQLLEALGIGSVDQALLVGLLDRIHVDSVHRGMSWLARVAHGLHAARSGRTAEADEVVAYCDRIGDAWGASIVAREQVRALGDQASSERWNALAVRFETLGFPAMEAQVRAMGAYVFATRVGPRALDSARRAKELATQVEVPGAVAIAEAALALALPEAHDELVASADALARTAGLLAPPWQDGTAPPVLPDVDLRTPPVTAATVREPVPLEVRCLGPLTVRVRGQAVDVVSLRPSARRTLRFLALHAGRHVHRDAIVDALWGGDRPGNALHSLHVSISSVRRALEPRAARGREQLLVRSGEAYSLALPPGSMCDVVDLDRLVDVARHRERALAARPARARDDAEVQAAARAWQDALDLYAGELFPSERAFDWVVSAREHFRLLAAEAADAVASLTLRIGHADAAAAAARRAIELDRWGDAGWRILIQALRLAGDDGSASRAERDYRAVLRELGVAQPDVIGPGTRPLRPPGGSWGSLGRLRRP